MKKALVLCALGTALLGVQAAKADTVAGSYTFTDQTSNNTLNVTASPNPGKFTEFGVPSNGISYTDLLFFGVSANIPGNRTSTQTDQLNVAFTITDPGTGSGNQSGAATEEQSNVLGLFDYDTGSITWNAPAVISLSDGQTLYIDLGDITLGTLGCGSADLCGIENATFTLTPTPSAAPEPSSLALLGTSILGAAGIVRRRMRL